MENHITVAVFLLAVSISMVKYSADASSIEVEAAVINGYDKEVCFVVKDKTGKVVAKSENLTPVEGEVSWDADVSDNNFLDMEHTCYVYSSLTRENLIVSFEVFSGDDVLLHQYDGRSNKTKITWRVDGKGAEKKDEKTSQFHRKLQWNHKI